MNRKIPLIVSIFPVIFLILILSFNVIIFGTDSLSGANQLALIFSAFIAALLGLKYGSKWGDIMKGISKGIANTTPAIIILLLIGSLAGTWLISGIIPAMIYYGLQILDPKIFLFATAIVSSIVSLATGSSWSTIATIGIALLGIGQAIGISTGLIAGAIISGAYFGDKLSPLSDTTNLASAITNTKIMTHIKYMMYTTFPSFFITLLIFLVIGFNYDFHTSSNDINEILNILENKFNVTPLLFLVPILTIFLIIKKIPAIPVLIIGTLLGAIFSFFFQSKLLNELSDNSLSKSQAHYKTIINSMSSSINLKDTNYELNNVIKIKYNQSPSEKIDPELSNLSQDKLEKLLNGETIMIDYSSALNFEENHPVKIEALKRSDLLKSGGMSGMLNTIWLIICAMIFGGVMQANGFLKRIAQPIIKYAKSNTSLISSTVGTCFFFNLTASDQYLSIVVPGKMYVNSYKKMNLSSENLSRTIEDSGTVTSVLIPWNTCGATQSSVLGVATLTYLPYCFFNLISPLMTILFSYYKIRIKKNI